MMKTLVFDIFGKFAHFKASDTTRENISYPFPPRTAILGLLGAILGLPRNSYWTEESLFDDIKIGIEIIKPINRTLMRVNYIQTRYPISIGKLKILVPKDPFEIKSKDQRGFSMPVLLNLLKDPGYRIFVQTPNKELFQNLENHIRQKKYHYPPYLGHANLLAWIEYRGVFEANPKKAGKYKVRTIFSKETIISKPTELDNLSMVVLFNIPSKMKYDGRNLELIKTDTIFFNPDIEKSYEMLFKENYVFEISELSHFSKKDSNLVVVF